MYDGSLTFLSGINELSAEHPLRGRQERVDSLEAVGVLKLDAGQRSATTRVVHNLPHHTFRIALEIIKDLIIQ